MVAVHDGKQFDLDTEEGRKALIARIGPRSYARQYLRNREFLPALKTDTNYYRGTDDGFHGNQRLRELYHRRARAAGIDTTGKVYEPELVRKGLQGGVDPAAWVPRTEGRSHIKRVLQNRRWSSEGRVEVAAPVYEVPDEKQDYRPADDLLEKATQMDIENHRLGKVGCKERRQLKEANAKLLSGNMNEP